ncbi:MAG: MATE family efflux transporter [Candidatus Methanoplasma sp.]|jgi:putative MATE family efflux protein|nr:MATE family efflux transporter [Candidatus Methanoplasma sp.]
MEDCKNSKEVETLLGDPKKAILAMAVPTAVALIAQSANNLIDAMWVAGLGRDALAAVGIVFPIFFIMIGISNGIGIGAASAISRRLGADNGAEADKTASHALVLTLIGCAVLTAVFLLFLEPILNLMGAGASEGTMTECMNYAFPIVLFLSVFMIVGVMSSILRSEGAAKRSMYVLILSAAINMVLDPLFIYDYGLGWGMRGTAAATVVSVAVSMFIIIYWYFIRKNLFIRFKFRGFRFDSSIIKDIFSVGLPASIQMTVISAVIIFANIILLQAGGDDGVAIYASDWRIIDILIIPPMGVAMGLVPVCAAAFGAVRYDKISTAYVYSLKISVLSMILVGIITAIFAPQILTVFTYGSDTEYLRDGMVLFLRIACIFMPFMAIGMTAESLFQSLGMGMKSLFSTLFRNFLLVPVCYIAMLATSGLTYIWWGIAVSEIAGSLFIAWWTFVTLRSVMKKSGPDLKTYGP